MTPQAARPPAFPVLRDSSLLPWPRSSIPCETVSKEPCQHGKSSYRVNHHGPSTRVNYDEFHIKYHISMSYPRMLKGPFKEIKLSVKEMVAVPYSSLSMFPRSPTCLTESEGAPWVLSYGLKCEPVDRHPPLKSPRELLVEFRYLTNSTP
jgi:hypothetical protein